MNWAIYFERLENYEPIEHNKILGEGAFSEVVAVRHKQSNKKFALKKINLKSLSKGDQNHLKDEISLHENLDHPHIVKFFGVQIKKEMVYFLLEYAENSCLFFYIHSQKGLPELLALRFAYQTALALQYLHSRNLIHRDLKPENILFDEEFNVKLCDFGWSCQLQEGNHRDSICGTYEYMSPEIVYQKQHDKKVDIWCLGILLYEMIHGQPPFQAENLREIKKEFQSKNIMIKKSLDTDIKFLLKNLLKIKSSERPSIEEVLKFDAFQKNMQRIKEPMTQEDFQILIRNFKVNIGSGEERMLPGVSLDNGAWAIQLQTQSFNFRENKKPQFKLDDLLLPQTNQFNKKKEPERESIYSPEVNPQSIQDYSQSRVIKYLQSRPDWGSLPLNSNNFQNNSILDSSSIPNHQGNSGHIQNIRANQQGQTSFNLTELTKLNSTLITNQSSSLR